MVLLILVVSLVFSLLKNYFFLQEFRFLFIFCLRFIWLILIFFVCLYFDITMILEPRMGKPKIVTRMDKSGWLPPLPRFDFIFSVCALLISNESI